MWRLGGGGGGGHFVRLWAELLAIVRSREEQGLIGNVCTASEGGVSEWLSTASIHDTVLLHSEGSSPGKDNSAADEYYHYTIPNVKIIECFYSIYLPLQ